jgi:stress-induced morphogen
MDPSELEAKIEAEIEDAEATVTMPRVHHDEQADDAHYAAVVVSPAFEDVRLVNQHQMVYDAIGEHMTESVHAMEIETYTPEQYAEREE